MSLRKVPIHGAATSPELAIQMLVAKDYDSSSAEHVMLKYMQAVNKIPKITRLIVSDDELIYQFALASLLLRTFYLFPSKRREEAMDASHTLDLANNSGKRYCLAEIQDTSFPVSLYVPKFKFFRLCPEIRM
ncbi:hypothetical protein EGR_10805 [Echinococcus granulosus]|uniref:Uncharacterized protein n=1 Tax=Echinococcus granulosus TaxID=6210 RepID=W6TZS3_ECHGR|nr:hypothetical protein EGR_10805 [Echinococcus granulosus]EUB54330.1 hypothetical protein EGR_10805 [Echinococcus granulosus]